jgi:hypothetical protein
MALSNFGVEGSLLFVLREALRLLRYLKLSDEISSLPRTAIAYSRVDMGRNPSAVPSSSKFLAFHLGSELGPIAQSYRPFFISPTRLSCCR